MLLIGRDLSPFVRRCAVTLDLYGMPYERAELSTATDLEAIRQHNRLARVPALVLDDGETLIDSTAILDHLDEQAGDKRLTPASGAERRAVLRAVFHAMGAAEKTILIAYERNPAMRDEAHISEKWIERLSGQVRGGLAALEAMLEKGDHLVGGRMTQADVTTAIVYDFIGFMVPALVEEKSFPKLAALTARMSELPPMQATSLDKYRKS